MCTWIKSKLTIYYSRGNPACSRSTIPGNGRPTKEDEEPTTAKEGAEKLARRRGKRSPRTNRSGDSLDMDTRVGCTILQNRKVNKLKKQGHFYM